MALTRAVVVVTVLAAASPAGFYPETMRHRLALVLTVIGAIALPVVMAATVLYASDAAIGDPAEPLTVPQFGTTGPGTTPATGTTDDRTQGGQTGGTTTGADDHGGSTGGGSDGGSGSSGGGSSHGGGGDGSGAGGSSGHGGGDD